MTEADQDVNFQMFKSSEGSTSGSPAPTVISLGDQLKRQRGLSSSASTASEKGTAYGAGLCPVCGKAPQKTKKYCVAHQRAFANLQTSHVGRGADPANPTPDHANFMLMFGCRVSKQPGDPILSKKVLKDYVENFQMAKRRRGTREAL